MAMEAAGASNFYCLRSACPRNLKISNPNRSILFFVFFSTLNPPFSPLRPSRNRSAYLKAEIEIRVCVNRTCRRQGSREALEILSGIAPANVSVNSCGCLGRCGAGPNLVVLPDAVLVSHCGTAARAAEVLASFVGESSFDDSVKNLEALALRKKAEEELEKGNCSEAEVLLSQAIDLKPSGGLNFIHRSRSLARLAMGNNEGALEDAEEALQVAPNYPQAYLCQGDAFLALEEYAAAEKSYAIALEIDPSIRRFKSFKARVAKLQEKLTAASVAS